MKLTRIEIKKFRGITELAVELDDVTVLIGENNIGKTSVLEALRFCLGRSLLRKSSPFGEYDYHLNDTAKQPVDAAPIEIVLAFKETKEDEWSDEVVQTLAEAVQVDTGGVLQTVRFRLMSKYAPDVKTFTSEWDFLDVAGNPLPKAKNPRYAVALQQIAPLFYLAALRDAAQEFRAQSQFWGPFIRNLTVDDEVRRDLERALAELNQRVVDAHDGLGSVKERLSESRGIVPLHADDPVTIEALPGRVFDLLARAQVMLTNKLGTKLPLARHGEGTQSLAVMLLFDAFLRSRLKEGYADAAEPILALEEPEAHLHPAAIWSLASMLKDIPGQKVIATHSGDLLASVPLTAIRRLRRENNRVSVFDIRTAGLSADDIRKIEYHVRIRRGSLLFARCWLLVEGETDFWMLPGLAKSLDIDLGRLGVSCVEFSQCGAETLIRCAKGLGIEWHCLADGDKAGNDYVTAAKRHLGTDPEVTRVTQLAQSCIEHCMWAHGYDAIYEAAVSPVRRKAITLAKGQPGYAEAVIEAAMKSLGKPALAQEVLAEAERRGAAGMPPIIETVIKTVASLAGAAG